MKFNSLEGLTDFTTGARLVITDYDRIRNPLIEKYFGSETDQGWCLHGYLEQNGTPRTLVTTYFPEDIDAALKVEDFTDVLIFKNVSRCLDLSIQRVLITARAEIASKAQAGLLGIKTGSPLLTTEMVYLTERQRTVEVTISNTSSEHFVLSYDVPLDGS